MLDEEEWSDLDEEDDFLSSLIEADSRDAVLKANPTMSEMEMIDLHPKEVRLLIYHMGHLPHGKFFHTANSYLAYMRTKHPKTYKAGIQSMELDKRRKKK